MYFYKRDEGEKERVKYEIFFFLQSVHQSAGTIPCVYVILTQLF